MMLDDVRLLDFMQTICFSFMKKHLQPIWLSTKQDLVGAFTYNYILIYIYTLF